MDLLISIKPKYVKNILNGSKKFEFRKKIFKKDINKIYIYSSSPKKKIVAHFTYSGFIKNTPEYVWEITNKEAGISLLEYNNYFFERDVAYAIKIKDLVVYETPIDPYLNDKKFYPPQSFMYIEGV